MPKADASPRYASAHHTVGQGAVRPARLADIEALIRLEEPFPSDRISRRSFRHLLTRGHADVLVFAYATDVAGDVVVLYRRRCRSARLYSLIVDPRHQQRGIARTLLSAAEHAARSRGMQRMTLEVRPDNRAAIGLYKKSGYIVNRRIDDYYNDHSPALRLSKSLADT